MAPEAKSELSGSLIDLASVQRWRKVFIAVGLFALLAWASVVRPFSALEHPVEHLGLVAILICIVGRAWCSLYIGGRKKQTIVADGPYSLCRNPLYVFSTIGAFGVGAQSGSLSVALVFAAASWLVFEVVVRREEAYLGATFGQSYADYRKKTSRFWPRMALWKDRAELMVRPAFFLRTVRDGGFFLIALPIFAALERVQQAGWLSAFLQLP